MSENCHLGVTVPSPLSDCHSTEEGPGIQLEDRESDLNGSTVRIDFAVTQY
jgi:hypothetical protein